MSDDDSWFGRRQWSGEVVLYAATIEASIHYLFREHPASIQIVRRIPHPSGVSWTRWAQSAQSSTQNPSLLRPGRF